MKKIFLILAVLIIIAVPVTAFAATSNSPAAVTIRNFCGIGINTTNLTDKQKADLNESYNKMIELRKETINKMVRDGLLTRDQGDLELKRLDDMVKYHNENGSVYRPGMMNSQMMSGYGREMMRGYN